MRALRERDFVLVVAWGNTLRQDDGVAGHVLAGVRSLTRRSARTLLVPLFSHQLAPEMAESVSRAKGVVFVDARRDGTPGEVRSEPVAPAAHTNPLAHAPSPQSLLLLAEQLYGRAPEAVLVSVVGERFGIGESLSPVVRRAVPRAIRSVMAQARAWRGPTPAVRPGRRARSAQPRRPEP